MNYLLHLVVMIEIYVMLGLSLNLMVGYTGLLTLAHAAFYGIGAYLTTLLIVKAGIGFLPALSLAIVGTVVLSLSLSAASLTFRGDHFILTTLAFQVLTFSVLLNWVDFTNGPFGIAKIPRPSIAGIEIQSLPAFSLFGFVMMSVVVGFLALVYRSPFCRALRAIREDELAAMALGKSTASLKVRSVAVTSACAAVAGGLYASYITFIDPTSFTTEESILMLSMVIVGGTGNFKGPLAGAVLLILLPEILRFVAIPDTIAANVRLIVYGGLLVALMRFRPQGMAGEYRFE
jgi:branched-chain amino acid transport system permease protein